MNYIIDPMFIYWLQVVPSICAVVGTIMFVVGLFGGVGIAVYKAWIIEASMEEDKQNKIWLNLVRCWIATMLIGIPILIFTPSKETMIGMYVAKVATVENVKSAYKFTKEEVKDLVTFTVGTINGTITNTLDHLPLKADVKLDLKK